MSARIVGSYDSTRRAVALRKQHSSNQKRHPGQGATEKGRGRGDGHKLQKKRPLEDTSLSVIVVPQSLPPLDATDE